MKSAFLESINNGNPVATDCSGDFLIKTWGDNNSVVYLYDARNFYKRGKECKYLRFDTELFIEIIESYSSPKNIFLDIENHKGEITTLLLIGDVILNSINSRSERLFTKGKLGVFGALTKQGLQKLCADSDEPIKIDRATFLKFMANNCQKEIKQVIRLTDDYASDAENNFGRGKELSVERVIQQSLGHPRAEIFLVKKGVLQFSTHHNNVVEISFDLKSK